AASERHKLSLAAPALAPVAGRPLQACRDAHGIVVEMSRGWANRAQIALASKALSRSLRVWLYWPAEGVVESVTKEGIASLRRHWLFMVACDQVIPGPPPVVGTLLRAIAPRLLIRTRRNLNIVSALIDRVKPVPFPLDALPNADRRIPGTGVYLRTDFWSKMTSGGSYGHTSYVV